MAGESRSIQRNAADPEQVKRAEKHEKRIRERRRAMYRAVMATPEGRFVMWDLITSAGVFLSPWSQFQMEIHRNIGRQDFGRRLLATLTDIDEEAYLTMEREARVLAKRDAAEVDAGHIASATQSVRE